jgi:anti-anti-sigma factor
MALLVRRRGWRRYPLVCSSYPERRDPFVNYVRLLTDEIGKEEYNWDVPDQPREGGMSTDLEVPFPGTEAPFRTELERRMNVTILRLHGALDLACVDELRRALESAQRDPAGKVIVDLRGLTFLDSFGMSALLAAAIAGRDGQAPVKFITGKQNVQRVFHLTGVEGRLEWLPEAAGQ